MKRILHILKNKYFIVTFAFVIIITFIDKNSIIRFIDLSIDKYRQERVMKQYRKDIVELDKKIKELSYDRDSLEKFARENYYFHEKDEEIFIVREQ
ncbi:MAG: septum formation initiator family protein [Bacteroidales bacterium]|nr:septum formation initiator family protein [Bacteroidales bacterium]MDY5824627.1 septum formation initiator family protein [Candidatus Coprenecus sp.]